MDDFLEEENKRKKKFIFFFFLLSILFHALLVLFFYVVPKYAKAPEIPKETQVVWVEPQVPQNFDIADIEKPPVEKRPQKAKFAGQYDSNPEQETVARPKPKPKVIQENPDSSDEPAKQAKASKPAKKIVPKPKPVEVAKEEIPTPVKEENKEEEKPKKEKTVAKKEPSPVEKNEVIPDKVEPKNLSDFDLKPEDLKPKKQAKNDSSNSTSPSPKDLSFRSAGSGLSVGRATAPDMFAHDYYPDYKIGGKTYLNVMKLQDISYFVRMKRILKMRWNPIPPIENYLMSNRLTMGKVECVVGVSLDTSGSIAEIFLIRSSGLGAYDRESVQTIRDSSPFASPPTEYIKEGRLNMSWTFTVYL